MDQVLLKEIDELIEKMRAAKPDDRSETARRYAVTVTELEKVYAYFATFVVRPGIRVQ